ncbi:IS110 family transposase [Candidatus Palauibacter sp.]|uniref:IS110 family transposase n=1 Tax=Candidatus Palauibacter sp. TaxID=3101350 RepID=UPI003AF2314F
MPGVGRTVLATLLAEASQPLRRRDCQALRCLCGVAPVTRRSGKSAIVVRRLAAHPRLRDALYHGARAAVHHDPASKAKYAALRARGHGHARALRFGGRPAPGRGLRHAQDADRLRSRSRAAAAAPPPTSAARSSASAGPRPPPASPTSSHPLSPDPVTLDRA